MQTDWSELDERADRIVMKYSVVGGVWNLLPMPLDVLGTTGTFSKMAAELASVYGVMIPGARARQIGSAIATGTASVMGSAWGLSFLGSRLLKFVPGYGFGVSLLVQAPLMGMISYAAGETLKDYFRKAKEGRDLSIQEFRDSFVRILKSKIGQQPEEPIQAQLPPASAKNGGGSSDAVEQLKRLHELYQAGVVTQTEYDAKKAELLQRI